MSLQDGGPGLNARKNSFIRDKGKHPRSTRTFFLACVCFVVVNGILASGVQGAEAPTPLVPTEENISDFEARRALAQSLAHLDNRHDEARQVYLSLLAEQPGLSDLQLEVAGLEAAQGHARECRRHVEEALRLGLKQDAEKIAAADLMNLWGSFRRAGKQYREYLQSHPDDRAVQLKLARLLMSSQRFEESETLYRRLQAQTPEDPDVRRGLVELKLQEKDFAAAKQLDPGATGGPRHESLSTMNQNACPCRLCCIEAERTGNANSYAARGTNDSGVPASMKQADAASAAVEELLQQQHEPAVLLEHAEACMRTGLTDPARRLLDASATLDPEFYPARVLKAGLLAQTHQYDAALELYATLLRDVPDSSRLQLERARTLGWSKRYDESLQAYAALCEEDPADPVPAREQARVAAWAKQFSRARKLYRTLGTAPGEAGDEARALIQRRAQLEGRAKEHLWNNRFCEAREACTELIAIEPGNEEARFDLAQSCAALGLRAETKAAYQELLKVDPLHSRAPRALECLELQRKPAVHFNYSYWKETSQGRAADLLRHRGTATVELPIANGHRLYFEEGLSNEAAPIETDISHLFALSGVRWTGVLDSRWSLSAGYRLKTDVHGDLPDVHEAHARVSCLIRDEVRLNIGYERLDEAHCEAALQQGITSENLVTRLDVKPLRGLELNGCARWTWYSDDNFGETYEGSAGYAITDHPRQFKISLMGQARGTDEISRTPSGIARVPNESPLSVDLIHPYWTPRSYAAGQVAMEWRHDLTNEQFTGNLTHYYQVRVLLGNDSTYNRSLQIDGGWHWDFTDRWTLDVSGMWYCSEAWRASSAQAGFRFRF